MATSYRNISANELADNLGKSVPTQGYITFPNGKKALVGITPLGSVDIRREMQSSYGLISIGTKLPMWLEDPRLIDAQSAQEVTNFSWLSFTSSLNSAAGVGVGVAELSGYSATMRFTRQNGTIFSPKVYTNGWRGGSTSRITTYKVTSVAGRILFYTGVALDVEKSVAGEQSWAKTTMNITFSAVAAFGGPVGFAIGTIYLGLDYLGVIDRDPLPPAHRDIMIQPIDNLRISIPKQPMPAIKRVYQYQPKQFIGPKPPKRY